MDNGAQSVMTSGEMLMHELFAGNLATPLKVSNMPIKFLL